MKISIITIVYNNADCIVDCLESVKNQTYNDVEHVVIDGGSTDGTQALIAPYVDKLGYYISEPDRGLYNALNKGIQKSTGSIIGILHSDDLFHDSNTLKKVVEGFQNSLADLIYANGTYVKKNYTDIVRRDYSSKPFNLKLLRLGWIPLHTTIYVRSEIYKKYGLYNESYKIASDYDISLRWFLERKINKVFLNIYVVKMRLGGKSTTMKLQKTKSMEDLKIINQYPLWGYLTLIFKIARKIPQYIVPQMLCKMLRKTTIKTLIK